MKMNIYINILCIILIVSPSVAQTQYSAQDLQNNYATITQQLQTLQNTVSTFPTQLQGNLSTLINNSLNQINQTYTTAQAQIQPYVTQSQTARTKAIINEYVALAIKQMQKQEKLIEVRVQQVQNQLPQGTPDGQSLSNMLQAVIDNFSSSFNQINATIQAKQQEWQQRMRVLEQTIISFSSQDKQSIVNVLNQAQALMNELNDAINQIYNTALNDINNLKNNAISTHQPADDAKRQLNFRITVAINDINKKVDTIETVLKDAESNSAQIVAQQTKKKESPDYKARDEYHQKIVQLMQVAAPVVEQFLALDPLVKKVIRSYIATGQYDSVTIEQITSQALHYIQLVASAYKDSGFTVHSFDNSNYVLIMVHWLSNFFNDLILYQIQYAKRALKDPHYFDLVSSIALTILGTQNNADQLVKKTGYTAVIQSLTQTYFSDTQSTVNTYYLQKMVTNSYDTFFNALNSMAAQWIKPTEQQLQSALIVYNQLLASIQLFPADKQADQTIVVNQNLGLLYANSATQLVKQISFAQDNSSFTTQAMNNYGFAAHYYASAAQSAISQSQKQKELTTVAQTYQIISNNLSQAIDNQTKGANAENSGDISSAITFYIAAENAYKAGSDMVDATRMNMKHQILLGNQSMVLAKNRLQQFLSSYKDQFQQYLNYLMLQQEGQMSNFDALIQNWSSAIQDALGNYQQALQSYRALSNFNNAITQSTIMKQFDALNNVVQLLSIVMNAQTYMTSADQYAYSKDMASLTQANQNYSQALSLFSQVDSLFLAKNSILKSLFSAYPSLLTSNSTVYWNYSTLATNHIARLYLELADQISQYDLLTAIQYYTAALHYGNLSDALKNKINEQLQLATKRSGQLDELFKQAQSAQHIAEQMSDNDWNCTSDQYVSIADTQWRTVINQYLSLYTLGYNPAKSAYINALIEYAQAYKDNVKDQYYPLLGSAFIYYRLYLFSLSQNDSAHSLLSLSQIKSNIQLYFNQARSLVEQINDLSKLPQAIDNQQKLNNWYTQFKQGIEEQQRIAAQYKNIDEIPLLIAQSINQTTQSITVQDLLNNGAIQFTDMLQMLADIYKQLANADFKQQRYDQAQQEYAKAISLYHQLGNDTAANQLQQQYSISLAHMFNDLLVTQNSVTIAHFSVPSSYELKVYSQIVPQQLVQQLGDPTKLSKTELAHFEISVASSLFLYHKITDLGLDYFSLMSQLSGNQIPTGLTQDQQDAVLQAVSQANDFKKDLTGRMAQRPTLGLRGQAQNGTSVLYLEEYYKPIPAIPSAPPIYQGYPSAYSYIYYALLLAAPPLAPGSQVQIGTTLYVPGNDSDFYNSLVNDLAQLYFSQGYSYQQALNAIKSCSVQNCPWQLLKNKQNNIQASLSDFMPLYNSMLETFNLMVAYYSVPFNYFAPPANTQRIIQSTAQSIATFNQFLGALYEQFGDDLQMFLIGNPLDQNYNTILTAIATQYSTAALYYNTVTKTSALEQKVAGIFTDAGNKIASQNNNYFGAIGLYYIAEQALEKIPSPTSDVQQKLKSVYLTRLSAAFKGATNNVAQYQSAKETPITIKSSSGQTQSMKLDTILQNYTNWLDQNGGQITGFDTGQLCTYNYYNGLLLDALIFYTATSIEFNNKIKAALGNNSSDDQMKAINQNGLNAITNYMNTNSISLNTLESIEQFVARADFKDLLLDGFEQFQSMALSADTNTALQGYAALSQWASTLNTAFGQVYMNDYLGGVSVQAWDNLAEALKAETDEIRAPSKNYVGDICQNYQ